MKKILIAIDGSEYAMKAVEYAAEEFSGIDELKITLLHVLPYPPAPFWDDGHIPAAAEKKGRDEAIARWLEEKRTQFAPLFRRAVEILEVRGLRPDQIETRTISDSIDVAGSILEEARDGGYRTLVVGRRGLSPVKQLLLGSVTNKIVSHGAGTAICIVE